MPEPENTNPNNPTPPAGTDPSKTGTPENSNQGNVDLSKLSDEEFSKFFDDPRAFNHPRFKTLAEAKKERDTLLNEKKEREKKELEDKGEHQKLAELAQKERDDYKTKYETSIIDNAILQAALSKGALDVEAVKALINRGSIKLDKDGTVTGVDDAIDTLAKSKEYLFDASKSQQRVGNPTNPSNPNNNNQKFTLSQINDARFYRKNEKAIKEAMLNGSIIDDRGQRQGPR